MSGLYLTAVTLHVLAALFWLGGMFFLGVVGAPALRGVEPAALRQQLFNELGVRFRNAGWVAIATLVTTGIIVLHERGLLHWDGVFGSAAFWGTSLGRALAVKLLAVAIMIVVSAVHDFALGPMASRLEAGTPEALAMRKKAAMLARVNALVGLVVVLAAVRLARGG